MSRYTGSSYKQARRTGISLLEMVKNLQDVHMDLEHMALTEKEEHLLMELN